MAATGGKAPPLLFRIPEVALTAVIEFARWAIYFTVGFAFFAAVAGAYARLVVGHPGFGRQMINLCGFLLYYVGVPLLVVIFAGAFLLEIWRLTWGRVGFFEENGLRPVEVLAYALVAAFLVGQANHSLHGRWNRLPARAATVLQLPLSHSASGDAGSASTDDGGSPAEHAEAGHAVLYLISRTAPQLRAQLLEEQSGNAPGSAPGSPWSDGLQSFAPTAPRAR